jgi:hypothetical protein
MFLMVLYPKNSVRCFMWMKIENPNSTLWLNCSRHGVSMALKKLFSCFFGFGLFCCFASYYGGIFMSWFQWWSAILVAQWRFFMSDVNHGSAKGLMKRFQRNKGMRKKINVWCWLKRRGKLFGKKMKLSF